MWSLRFVLYVMGAIGAAIAAAGYAEFDVMTGAFDLHEINLYTLAGTVVSGVSSALASIARWRGWGKK